jgi:SAM-dependent methyltransferase
MYTQRNLWETGIPSEVVFWDQWLESKGSQWPEDYEFRTNPNSLFQSHFLKYLPAEKETIDILDVGSGPLTYLGKKIEGKNSPLLNITGTDPLADKYMTLLRKHGIKGNFTNIKANSEELSNHLPLDFFDFIYMRNALDHAYDPLLSIGEMIRVLGKGRYLVLEHENNEAENENYEGLHQWNIQIEEGAFIVWNKSIRYNLSEHYKTDAEISCHANETHNYIEIRKFL